MHARVAVLTVALAAALTSGLLAATTAADAGPVAVPRVNWTSYLHDATHSSVSPATAITPANAAGLAARWTWTPPAATASQPKARFDASPVVWRGTVFIGSQTGEMFAVNLDTGALRWRRFLGFTPRLSCSAKGITATAALAADPATGRVALYAVSGDGRLWSLDPSTGAVNWQVAAIAESTTVSDFYPWASPVVVGGRIYVGLSSSCDNPLVPGGVLAFDQATGAAAGGYATTPPGVPGASVWTTPAVDPKTGMFVTTGNLLDLAGPGDGPAIVRVDPGTMARLDAWRMPLAEQVADSDFGSSPTVFTATIGGVSTRMVGACNKNGIYYAWRARNLAAGPVWRRAVGPALPNPDVAHLCLAAAVWDRAHGRLVVAGNAVTIGGVDYPGSVWSLDPATGAVRWQVGIASGPPLGSPSLDAGGVLAVPVIDYHAWTGSVELLDAATGAHLATLAAGQPDFAQPAFADGSLVVATEGSLTAYSPTG